MPESRPDDDGRRQRSSSLARHDDHDDHDDEERLERQERQQVETAIRGLNGAVRSVLDRYEKRRETFLQRRRRRPDVMVPPELTDEKEKRIRHIIRHMRHCLTELLLKYRSLQTAFQCLQSRIWPQLLENLKDLAKTRKINIDGTATASSVPVKDLTAMLQHFFMQFLRLKDGKIILVSGECRHSGDVALAENFRKDGYGSRLTDGYGDGDGGGSIRADGYTRLYSSDLVYSGASWDEFMDVDSGLRERLLRELRPLVPPSRRESLWEDLTEERGATALEALLDRIEGEGPSTGDLKRFAERAEVDLKDVLVQMCNRAVRVRLNSADKMEKLEITVGSIDIRLERRARDFQISDPAGVLPVGHGIAEWTRAMTMTTKRDGGSTGSISNGSKSQRKGAGPSFLPSKNRRREKLVRRNVILDSDDDDDDSEEGPVAQPPVEMKATKEAFSPSDKSCQNAGGLLVRVQHEDFSKKGERSLKSSNPSSSSFSPTLREIKATMGADVDGLAAAREGLEAEEANALRAAAAVDDAPADRSSGGNGCAPGSDSQRARELVTRLKRELRQSILGGDPDDDDVWNARERLREACMDAGNILCSSTEHVQDALRKALEYYSCAANLVMAQQRLLAKKMGKQNRRHDELLVTGHYLFLLLGQAQVNRGKAKLELSQKLSARDSERKLLLREAIQELDRAVECAKEMRSRSEMDQKNRSDAMETMLEATGLESMALRWTGSTLWLQGQRKHAVEKFEHGGSLLLQDAIGVDISKDVFSAELKARIECYYSWATLANLVCKALELADASAARDAPHKYDELVLRFKSAVDGASLVSRTIRERIDSVRPSSVSYSDVASDHEIETPENLLQWYKDIEMWWERKSSPQHPIFCSCDSAPAQAPQIPRNDIGADRRLLTASALPERLVIADGSSLFPRMRKRKGGNSGYSNIGPSSSGPPEGLEPFTEGQPQKKFRKWGDDFLPRTTDTDGNPVPLFSFPSVAPEMPPAIKAIWESNRGPVPSS